MNDDEWKGSQAVAWRHSRGEGQETSRLQWSLPEMVDGNDVAHLMTRLADDQIRFDPHLTGTCVFTIEHYDLRKLMSRWV